VHAVRRGARAAHVLSRALRCQERGRTDSACGAPRIACLSRRAGHMSALPAVPMDTAVAPGALIDGWRIGELLHQGGTARIYHVHAEGAADPAFPVLIKAPPLGPGQPTLGVISFEMEQMILPTLSGPYVPRFVATGE